LSKSAKKLVIVESPSKAKTINKFLGRRYHVEASMGHVRDLPKSKMGIDVENDFEPHYIIPTKARKTVTKLKKTAKGKEAIYLAPDPDREGEAISWHLAAIFEGLGVPVKRVVFNEITKDAVLEAFEKARDIDINLVDAQQARRVMDRILGYNLSPLLWKKVSSGLSAGRVQSIALRLIVEREKEIQAFTPEEYWTLGAVLSSQRDEVKDKKFESRLDKIKGKKAEIKNDKQAAEVKQALEKATFVVNNIEEKQRKRKPTAPYTTSKLQQEAYTKLNFTAAKTMQLAQRLYEGVDLGKEEGTVGLITYMRTDSVRVADSALESVRKYIENELGKDYLPAKPNKYKAKKGAQEAHESIRPTGVERHPDLMQKYLKGDEFKLYQLIWRKFVASQMNPSIDKVMTVSILADTDYLFKTTGTKNVFPGFLAVYGVDPKSDKNESEEKAEDGEKEDLKADMPVLEKGETLLMHELMADQHFTKPPARYNDASIVKTLEEKGIGRPSTYAPTLHTILMRHYIERRSGALIPTELGTIVIELLVKHFPRVLDYDFTAHMEDDLDLVEEGKLTWRKAVQDFYEPFASELDEARETMEEVKKEVIETDIDCEKCGKKMVERMGRFGRFLACGGFPECRFTRSIPTGHKCPEEDCEGELVSRRARTGKTFFGCSKYPDCRHVTNSLPKGGEEANAGEAAKDGDVTKDAAPAGDNNGATSAEGQADKAPNASAEAVNVESPDKEPKGAAEKKTETNDEKGSS